MGVRQAFFAFAASGGLLLSAVTVPVSASDEPARVVGLARQASDRVFRAEYAAARRDLDDARALVTSVSLPQGSETAALDHAEALWYDAMGQYRRAAELARSALAVRRRTAGEEHPDALASANLLAFLRYRLGDSRESEQELARVLEVRRRTLGPTHKDVAESENDLAWVRGTLSRPRESKELFDHALAITEAAFGPDDPLAATIRYRRAGTLRAFGRLSEGAPDATEALRIRQKSLGESHPATGQAHQLVSEFAGYQGRLDDAERHGRIALETLTKAYGESHPEVGRVLNNQARFWSRTGEIGTALTMIERALETFRRTLEPGHPWLAALLETYGDLLNVIGNPGAEKAYLESLQIRERKLGPEHPEVASALGRLAGAYLRTGQVRDAMPLLLRAADMFEKAGMSRHVNAAVVYRRLGKAHFALGDLANAEANQRLALEAVRATYGPDTPHASAPLVELALLNEARSDYPAARALFGEALVLATGTNLGADLAWIYFDYASFLFRRGETDTAIFFSKKAINVWQRTRGRMSQLDERYQQDYATRLSAPYRFAADLLVSVGRIAEAEETLGLLKVGEYLEFVRSPGREGSPATMTGAEIAADRRLAEIAANLVRLSQELEALRRRGDRLSETDAKRRDSLEGELARQRQAFDGFLDGLYKEFAKASPERNRELGERQLDRLGAIRGTLRELGAGAVLVNYLVTQKRVAIIVTTPTAQVARESAIPEERLYRLVRDYRRALQQPASDVRKPSRELFRVLVEPIAKDLEDAGARTLMLSLDGVLRYAPFAALHDGERFLVERFDTALYTEVARDKLKDRPGRDWRMAGLGVTQGIGGFEPLPAVKEELEGIRGAILPGEVWLNADFTADRLGASVAKGYPLLHVASHFQFRPGTEADSFLLLGDGNRLSLREVRQRNFDFSAVDLVTLSACETGSGGGRDENGREVEGLGALVQNLGAKGVIATLWPVADGSTGEFMKEFYRSRQSDATTTKAAALRRAQLVFLDGAQRGEGPDEPSSARDGHGDRGRYAHPFYWAPFILMGNWL